MSKELYKVVDSKKIRVIIDTDAACEADDQFAVVHALMTQRFDVRGIISTQFCGINENDSVERSHAEILRILDLMDIDGISVFRGLPCALSSETDYVENEASDFIIDEALRLDEHRLFVFCQGAATNLANALIKKPEIAEHITCIWIGGAPYPKGGWEFNLMNDYHAANVLFQSGIDLWQVPMNCYAKIRVSYSELQTKVYPCGKIGKYLFEQMQAYAASENAGWTMGESWSLGDSPAVGLALDFCIGDYDEIAPPIADENGYYANSSASHKIRVYRYVDPRFILEDMFAKLKIFFG